MPDNNVDWCMRRQRCARSHPQECVCPAQTKQRVRFLPANWGKMAMAKLTSNVVRTVAVIFCRGHQRCGNLTKRKLFVVPAHQTKKRRPHKKEEGYERRHRISGQSENRAISSSTEEKRLAGFDCDPPKIGSRAGSVQRRFHQVSCSDRNA